MMRQVPCMLLWIAGAILIAFHPLHETYGQTVRDAAPAAETRDPHEPAQAKTPRESRPVEVSAADSGIRAKLTCASDRAEVGQTISVEVNVVTTASAQFESLEIPEQLGKFETRNVVRTSTREGESRSSRITFQMSTYDSQEVVLPALNIKWKDEAGAQQTLELGPVSFEVNSLIGENFDPAQFKDIKGAVAIDLGWNWWMIALIGAGIGGICLLLLLRRAKKQKALRELPCDIWALAQFDALERENLVSKGEVHAYWVSLSTVVREYIERRFDIAAPDQTTKEFLARAGDHPLIGAQHRHVLTDFLRAADMVKFAAHRPPAQDCARGLAAARDFVRDTAPVAEPTVPAAQRSEVTT